MSRTTRYQGAIVQGHQILLILHREHVGGKSYWVIPGGGREPGEGEEACVRREMREETHLEVEVVRLLLDREGFPGGVYKRLKTYLCRAIGGEARPGFEPEEEAAHEYAIVDVGWFDLREPGSWEPRLASDPITVPLLMSIRNSLGYADAVRKESSKS